METSNLHTASTRPRGMKATALLCGIVVALAWASSIASPFGGHIDWHFVLLGSPIYAIGMFLYGVLLRSYYNGKGWARILLLIQAVPSVLVIVLVLDETNPLSWRIGMAAYGITFVSMLFWLNTQNVKRYFRRSAAS